MRNIYVVLIISLIYSRASAQNEHVLAKNPNVITGKLIGITNASGKGNTIPEVQARDLYGIIRKDRRVENDEYKPTLRFKESPDFKDNAAQQGGGINPTPAAPSTGLNFDGLGYTSVCPADPTLAVGPNHILQMINGGSGAYVKVWNKSGTVVLNQIYMDAITGKGGLGDPIALYDNLADRFVITEFANSPETGSEGLIIAVSQSSDPTSTWYTYYFATSPTTLFPDYPKFSVWPTAYYCKTNNFNGNSYSGASIWAFDRTKMLAGNATATVQVFSMGTLDKYYTMCPVGLSGGSVQAGDENGLFAYMNDNGFVGGGASDSIGLVQCNINFTTPSSSSITAKASFAVTSFSPAAPNITQPAGGQALDGLDYRIMNQPQYRNFGGASQSIVLCHLATSSRVAGVRWYELKKTTANWTLNQQSTYSPSGDHRFMSSININAAGDIGLMYNVSSKNVYPSIRFTGRLAGQALNTMTIAETTLIAGTKSSNCFSRYGDYNHVVVDPSGNSFWGTGMYNKASSWSTRVANFSLNGTLPLIAPDPLKSPLVSADVLHQYENKTLVSETGIYPIPATSELNVRLNKADQSILTVTDVKGSVLTEFNTASTDNKINIAKLSSGMYFLKITSGTLTESYKFIKE